MQALERKNAEFGKNPQFGGGKPQKHGKFAGALYSREKM